MIAGIGLDIVDINRIRRAIDRHGSHFLDHVFADDEQNAAPQADGRYAYYAARWAAKEAVAKALGTGIGRHCAWTDVRVQRDTDGPPHVRLTGAAAETAQRLRIARIHLTLTHERHIAGAQVIAERDENPTD